MNRRTRARCLLLLLPLIAVCGGSRSSEPFAVPPHGEADLLVTEAAAPPPTAMAFDARNRPYIVNNRDPESFGIISTLRDGRWVERDCRPALQVGSPAAKAPQQRVPHALGEIVFDDADNLYATIAGALLFSRDQGRSFQAYPLPVKEASLELRSGPSGLAHPPAIALVATGGMKADGERWGRRTRLSVLLPHLTAAGLELGEPIVISEDCLVAGSGGHSGGTSFAVSTGDQTHLVWAEMPPAGERGNPTWVATVDRNSRQVLGKRRLAVAGPEAPDVHSRPTITADQEGTLHVLTGAHGQPFLYLRSLEPGRSDRGWTPPAALSPKQTYASIVCDGRGKLHSVFRAWLPHASLGYQARRADEEAWSDAETLVHGALERGVSKYGIFYHRLFIDRRSTLYLAYTFWEKQTAEEGRYPEELLASTNGGKTWHRADSALLIEGISRR